MLFENGIVYGLCRFCLLYCAEMYDKNFLVRLIFDITKDRKQKKQPPDQGLGCFFRTIN